jgi:hypothetical protein
MKKLLPLQPKPFHQHRIGNLGTYAHPPAKTAHRTIGAKKPQQDPVNIFDHPDYRVKSKPKQNKRFDISTPANRNTVDFSDAKSESYPGGFGTTASAKLVGKRAKLAKPRSGLDIMGIK